MLKAPIRPPKSVRPRRSAGIGSRARVVESPMFLPRALNLVGLLTVFMVLAGCLRASVNPGLTEERSSANPTSLQSVSVGRPAMGTILEVSVVARDLAEARRLAERALLEAKRWDDVLTTWRSEGELARFNSAAGTGWQSITDDLASAFDRMIALSRQTQNAFDPAVGMRVQRLREGGAGVADRPRVASVHVALELRPGEARLPSGVAIDAGGIGKGIALDSAVDQLQRAGALAAFLDFGGSSQIAFGFDDRSAPLLVVAGLLAGEVLGVVPLADGSLSTSRTPALAGAGAIVDPRSGREVLVPRVATVLASTATLAEAWSTALVVRGREGIADALASGVEVVVADEGGVFVSPGFGMVAD